MRSASRKVRWESDADPMMSSDEDDRPHGSRKRGPLYKFSQRVNISLCLFLHIHIEHLAERHKIASVLLEKPQMPLSTISLAKSGTSQSSRLSYKS